MRCRIIGAAFHATDPVLLSSDFAIVVCEVNHLYIPNYGEKQRYSETITTAFVESTVNEVIAKRMVKKQQLQWSPKGVHAKLQTRTATLNCELSQYILNAGFLRIRLRMMRAEITIP